MTWNLRKTAGRADSVNKSLYLPRETVRRLEELATAYNTSFNNIVVSMVAACLEEAQAEASNA